jgi:hypothetical protein
LRPAGLIGHDRLMDAFWIVAAVLLVISVLFTVVYSRRNRPRRFDLGVINDQKWMAQHRVKGHDPDR